MNDQNINFYDNLGVDPFKKLSEIGGFNTYVDLEVIYPFIERANSILELGAGYGRCLDFFLGKNFKGRLIAVEKAKPYLAYLQANYVGKVEILDVDIKRLEVTEKVDAILWMFSGIIDFSRAEQLMAIKKLSSFLNPGGNLIIDIPRIGFKTYANHKDNQRLTLKNEYGVLECYIPSIEDIKAYVEEATLSGFTIKEYNTTSEKARTVYILHKGK